MKWKDKLINDVINRLNANSREAFSLKSSFENNLLNIHLAIFTEPFLGLLFNREKKIESRFSINNVMPYQKVLKNDIVLVKKTGGPIVGVFFVNNVYYYSNLNSLKINELEKLYSKDACWHIDPYFLNSKKISKFLTIIEIGAIQKIEEIEVLKKDRAGWSIIRAGLANTLFGNKS